MIKISRMTDYAIVVMAQMTLHDGQMTASQLAADTGVPEPSVAKLLKKLAREGLVRSWRGVNGGYALERDPSTITIEEIIISLDGPIALTSCVEGGKGDCVARGQCPVLGHWDKVNTAIRSALSDVSLADMVTPGHAEGLNKGACACASAAVQSNATFEISEGD